MKPDLSRYDSPRVPNFVERHYNDGLALGDELEEAYDNLSGLLEQAFDEARRAPEGVSPDQIERTEEEVAAISSLSRIGEWLCADEVAVFERDLVGTVERFNRWSRGWSRRIGDAADVSRPRIGDRASIDSVDAECVDKEVVFVGEVFYFELTPDGEQRIRDMFAAAKGAADQLSTPEGRQVMRSLLDTFEECSKQARSALDTLHEAANQRFRLSDEEFQDSTDTYAERLSARTDQLEV